MSGNPKLTVRYEPEALDRVKEFFPGTTGKAGGVNLAVRKLLALAMDETLPRQYGESERATEVDEIEEAVRCLERGQGGPVDVERCLLALEETTDPVDRLRLHAAMGRLMALKRA